ncbi:hypothetical protein FACS1894184_09220 [Clostridia bacterium]|nr:hypothetical protein FACS1894184_09220 [Clostridia bacterium]
MPEKSPTKVVTGVVRLSYSNVWEPKSVRGGTPKYSASLIIDKKDSTTITAIQAAIDAAMANASEKIKKAPKATLKMPLKDGDEYRPSDKPYENSLFVNALSLDPPMILDLARNPITDKSQVYSGCYIRASLNFYAFDADVNKGIACGLNGIQLVRKGEPLGGRGDVSSDFADDFTPDDEDDIF